MYWTDKSVDKIEMWRVCWLLNSWRSLVTTARWKSTKSNSHVFWLLAMSRAVPSHMRSLYHVLYQVTWRVSQSKSRESRHMIPMEVYS